MHNPGRGIRLRGSARTSVGQVRENNEDNIHLRTGDGFMLALVADGMGGAAAGEEASRIAVEIIDLDLIAHDAVSNSQNVGIMPEDMLQFRLRHAIQKANLSIMRRAIEEPELRGMGTTVTLALLRGPDVTVAHVGDSRAYLVNASDRSVQQITSDHSFVEALLAAGHITPEQAEEHPMRNVLYRALGQAEDMDVDLYRVRLRNGDRLVLCSDGLTRHVKAHEIARIVLSDDSTDEVSQMLIDVANERGGEDNVSVIVIMAEADGPGEAMFAFADDLEADDDDDTLQLIGGAPDVAEHGDDLPELTLTPLDTAPTIREKMSAERLSDSEVEIVGVDTLVEFDSVPPEGALDKTIASRARGINRFHRRPSRRPPPSEPDVCQGEGHDTRTPDQ